jgi:hypothetical protein
MGIAIALDDMGSTLIQPEFLAGSTEGPQMRTGRTYLKAVN